MDVTQLLNPVPSQETAFLSHHISSKKTDQQLVTHFVHISGYQVPFPTNIEPSNCVKERQSRRRRAGRNYRESKRVLREELIRTQRQLESVQQINRRYEEKINHLQQQLELSMRDSDVYSTDWHRRRFLSLSNLPPDTTYCQRPEEWESANMLEDLSLIEQKSSSKSWTQVVAEDFPQRYECT